MKNISELFAPPINLHAIPVFGNMKLYTSESLRKNYIKAMSKTEKLKPVISKISNLVDNNLIIPAFMTKGIIRTLFFRMFPIDSLKIEPYVDNDTIDTYYRSNFNYHIKGLRYYRELVKSYKDRKSVV